MWILGFTNHLPISGQTHFVRAGIDKAYQLKVVGEEQIMHVMKCIIPYYYC